MYEMILAGSRNVLGVGAERVVSDKRQFVMTVRMLVAWREREKVHIIFIENGELTSQLRSLHPAIRRKTAAEEEDEEEQGEESGNEGQQSLLENDSGDGKGSGGIASSSTKRPSFVLTTVPDRRNSFSVQYVKAAWSQLYEKRKRRRRSRSSLREEESVVSEQQPGTDAESAVAEVTDEEALLGQETSTSGMGPWLKKTWQNFLSAVIKSLKDLKMFMW